MVASGSQANERTSQSPSSSSSTSAPSRLSSSHAIEADADDITAEAKRVALAASIAAVTTKSVLHPIDTIKCRLQVMSMTQYDAQPTPHGTTTLEKHLPRQSVLQRFRQLRTQYTGLWGLRYLYGGLPVKLLMYVPYQTTYLVTYETAKKVLHTTEAQKSNSDHPVLSHLWRTTTAAVVAEVGSCAIRIPMETVKMRIQATKANNTGEAFRQLRRNGARAYARLVVPHTLTHDVPYSIIQWIVYETLRPWTMQWHTTLTTTNGASAQDSLDSRPQSFSSRYGAEMLRAFMSGGFSGCVAATLTIPLDNIRTRTVVASTNNPNVTARQVIRRTLEQEGTRGFFKGGGMRVLWVTSNLACYFPIFELMKSLAAEAGY